MPDATGKPTRILIVEDDADVRESLAEILEEEGYRTSQASNGQEALESLRSGSCPCLILLDLMMPIMDGEQFRNEQRRLPDVASVPVVLMSANRDASQHAAAMDAVDCIKKPIGLEDLLDVVERHCCRTRKAISLA